MERKTRQYEIIQEECTGGMKINKIKTIFQIQLKYKSSKNYFEVTVVLANDYCLLNCEI